jgi:hypothetical protein
MSISQIGSSSLLAMRGASFSPYLLPTFFMIATQLLQSGAQHIQNCIRGADCPLIGREFVEQLPPHEQKITTVVQSAFEALRCKASDSRDKFLYISTSAEERFSPGGMSRVLQKIDTKFDLRYQLVKGMREVCSLIRSAHETGKVSGVVIHGYGDFGQIVFPQETFSVWNSAPDCFNRIDAYTEIFLILNPQYNRLEPSNRKNFFESVGQRLADDSARKVHIILKADRYNTLDLSDSNRITTDDSQPFSVFNPRFPDCTASINLDQLPVFIDCSEQTFCLL